jgi:hypothetical protein
LGGSEREGERSRRVSWVMLAGNYTYRMFANMSACDVVRKTLTEAIFFICYYGVKIAMFSRTIIPSSSGLVFSALKIETLRLSETLVSTTEFRHHNS